MSHSDDGYDGTAATVRTVCRSLLHWKLASTSMTYVGRTYGACMVLIWARQLFKLKTPYFESQLSENLEPARSRCTSQLQIETSIETFDYFSILENSEYHCSNATRINHSIESCRQLLHPPAT